MVLFLARLSDRPVNDGLRYVIAVASYLDKKAFGRGNQTASFRRDQDTGHALDTQVVGDVGDSPRAAVIEQHGRLG